MGDHQIPDPTAAGTSDEALHIDGLDLDDDVVSVAAKTLPCCSIFMQGESMLGHPRWYELAAFSDRFRVSVDGGVGRLTQQPPFHEPFHHGANAGADLQYLHRPVRDRR